MENESSEQRDHRLAERIQDGDRQAFEELFFSYGDQLCAFAAEHVDANRAEDIVQEVFCDLWRRREEWEPRGTIKAYLYRAVRNTSLDHLDHQEVKRKWEEEEKRRDRASEHTGPADALHFSEFERAMESAVDELPERRRLVYRMARQHDMTYAEIASALDIAKKTVENHMGRALKSLRKQLAEYASFLQ